MLKWQKLFCRKAFSFSAMAISVCSVSHQRRFLRLFFLRQMRQIATATLL